MLFFLFFVTGVGSEIECVGTTESANILILALQLPVQLNWILKKTLRSGCSVSWWGANI